MFTWSERDFKSSVQTSMNLDTIDLHKSHVETLDSLRRLGGKTLGLSQLADMREVSEKSVSNSLKVLEDEGFVDVDRSQKPYIFTLTGDGFRLFVEGGYGRGSVQKLGSKGGVVRRLHGLVVVVDFRGEILPAELRGKLESSKRVNHSRYDSEATSFVWTNKFFLRLHKESLTVQVREGVNFKGENIVEVFKEFQDELEDLLYWISRVSGLDVDVSRYDLRRCELAFEDHYLAELVEKIPDLDLSDFVVRDEDIEKDVLKLDSSFGKELEALSPERAEEIGRTVESEMIQLSNRGDAVRRRHRFENCLSERDVDPERLVDVPEQVDDLDRAVRVLLSRALDENNHQNVDDENGSRRESYENPVQELFMRYWRDDDYNRPFFHKDSGGLMVFKKDGSGCEKILSGEEVERLS